MNLYQPRSSSLLSLIPYKPKTMRIKEVPDGIIILEYNQKDRMIHFDCEPQKHRHKYWVSLKAMCVNDAIQFCQYLEKKYVTGRKSGILPELSVVKLEQDLFLELKHTARKLAGR